MNIAAEPSWGSSVPQEELKFLEDDPPWLLDEDHILAGPQRHQTDKKPWGPSLQQTIPHLEFQVGPADNGSAELLLRSKGPSSTDTDQQPAAPFRSLSQPTMPWLQQSGPHVQCQVAADPGSLDNCIHSMAPRPLSRARGPN
ncbi:hypothetical protein MG293_020823 [Ovis ammon polii]|uniref:Uncharacterized protein n=1 Tax=Ovis ammon polii TaxID=230172 RepID=A0AAD4XZ48_OVIAM|nr:hypothetical protein MG293_020823 [Ovis ammon polii]KAI4550012.1 hypothetical protein MJT46_019161 [Ovis ammon polii x Ovis aries]